MKLSLSCLCLLSPSLLSYIQYKKALIYTSHTSQSNEVDSYNSEPYEYIKEFDSPYVKLVSDNDEDGMVGNLTNFYDISKQLKDGISLNPSIEQKYYRKNLTMQLANILDEVLCES